MFLSLIFCYSVGFSVQSMFTEQSNTIIGM